MVREFPEFSRFSLIFYQKVPFSRFSRFSLSRTNPAIMNVRPSKFAWSSDLLAFSKVG